MSFGSGFGGFGANKNNQQTTTGFGGFGQNNNQTTGGFGSTTNTGFGATNNNPGGSLFGGGNNTTTTGGFGSSGGFGASTQPKTGFGASTGGSLFGGGATTQAAGTGFGGFGSTATNNTTSGFGSGTTGGSLFGGQAQTQPSSGFGAASTTGGGLFGSGTSTGFGQTGTTTTGGFGQPATTGFGQTAQQTPQNTGTAATPFQPHSERDGGASNMQQYFQNIVCQQPYTQFSQEELRAVDYNQGRRYGNQNGQAGAFGQSTGFGGFGATANNNTTTNTGFGNSTGGGLFGSQQNQTPAPAFGNATSTGFGTPLGGGLFGAKPAASTGGLFGSTPATSGQSTGGLFGTSGGTGAFGSSTGGFGSANNSTTGTGLFGAQNQAKPGGIFGSSTNTGFGAPASTNAFGQQNQTGGGLFGSTQNNQQQSTPFGQPAQATANPFGGGFGQSNNQPQQQGTSPFGQSNSLFGQQNQQKPGGLFGSTTNTGGLFGQAQQQPQQTNSLFGNNNQQNQTGGLFGNTQDQAKTGGLFGTGNSLSTGTGGGLFGNTLGQNNQNQQSQGGGLFGQQNQTKSLFGATNNNNSTTGNSLFGGSFGQNNQQPQQNQGNSLFGSQTQQQPQMGNSLFGNTQNQQQAPQPAQYLTTSINNEMPYGNTHLFAGLHTSQAPVGPLVTPLSGSQRTRQRVPLPTYRLNASSSTRLITPQKRGGYGFDYSSYGTPGSAISNASPMYNRSLLGSGSLGRSLSKSMSMNNMRASYNAEDSILSPGAFSPGGMRGGSGSMKKLKINRSLRTDLFGVDGASENFRASPLKKKVSFEADQSSQQPTDEGSSALVRTEQSDSPTPSAEEQGYLRSNRSRAPATNGATAHKEMEQVKGNELAVVPEDSTPSPPPAAPKAAKTAADIARANQKDMEPGAYYMLPTLADLKKMSRKDRANITPFTVGREHAGKIEFSKVDLTNVDLDTICGGIVRIELRTATVYADHAHKPEQGKALNVPSLITLDNSWPRSKGGKLPVYERKGPRFDKHIERLRRVEGTEFVKYDYEKGSWIFRVQHFSTYTFDYSDDESMLSPPPSSRSGGLSGLMPRNNGAAPQLYDDDEVSNDDSSRHSSQMDDTFEFRTSKTLPGAFDGDVVSDDEDLPLQESENMMEDEPIQSIEQQESSVFNEDASTRHSFPMDGSFDDQTPLKQSYGNGHLISPLKATPIKPGRSILKTGGSTPWRAEKVPYADVEWAQQLQRTLSPKKQDRSVLRQSQAHFAKDKPITIGPLGGFTKESQPFATTIDVMNSLFAKDQPSVEKKVMNENDDGESFKWPYAKRNKSSGNDQIDAEKAFLESFKPSWATDHNTAKSAYDNQQTLPHKTPALATLQHLRKAASIVMDDGKPYAESDGDISFTDLAELTEHTDAGTHEKTMWKLAALLFDLPADGEKEEVRMNKVSNFWRELVTANAESQIAKLQQRERRVSVEELALLQLSSNDVWAAVETLTAGRDFHLSTMIAQLGAADEAGATTQKAIADQIDEWRESNSWSEFSHASRALYELLAGNTCISTGKGAAAGPENRAETFNITSHFQLDWRRAFALKLWYGTAMNDKLDDAIVLYAKDVAAYRESVRPVPWFVEQKIDMGFQDSKREDRQDILFGLLKIYAYKVDEEGGWMSDRVKLADIIASENVSGNPMNSRLSFHLYQTLSARGIIDFADNDAERDHKADNLTKDYAFQLSSSAANLVDAVFVTLHLHDSAERETAVRALLNLYAGSIGDDADTCPVFTSLVTELKLPCEWIWNAKALHAKNVLGSDVKDCRFRLAGGDENGAHNVFVQSVAPRCIIEEDRRTLAELLELFKSKGVDKSLNAWSDGGSLYDDYLRILHVSEKGGNAGEALQLAKELGLKLVEMQRDGALIIRIAATEMAGEIEEAVLGFGRRLGRDVQKENVLPAMPMASDEVLKRVEQMSARYYAKIEAF